MFAAGFLCRPSAGKGEESIEIHLEKDSDRYSELLMKEIFLEPQLDYSDAFDLRQDSPSALAGSNYNERKDEHPSSVAVGSTDCMDALKFDVDLNLVQQGVLDQEPIISSEAIGKKEEKKLNEKLMKKLDSVIQHVVMEKEFDYVTEKKFDFVDMSYNDDLFENSAPSISSEAIGKKEENKLNEKLMKKLDSVIQHVVMEKKFDYVTEKKFDLVDMNYNDDLFENSAPSTARSDVKIKDASKKGHVRSSIQPGKISIPEEPSQKHHDHGIHLGSPLCGDAFTLSTSELSQEVCQHNVNGTDGAACSATSCPRDLMHRNRGCGHCSDNIIHNSPKHLSHKIVELQDSCRDHGRDSAPDASLRDANSKGHGKDNARHCSPREASSTGHHSHRKCGSEHSKHDVPNKSPKEPGHTRIEQQDSCYDHGRDNALHASPRDSNTKDGNVFGNASSTRDGIHENPVQRHAKDNTWHSNPRGAGRTGHQRESSKSGTQRGDTVSPRFRKPEEHHHGQREGEAQRRDLTSVPKGLVSGRVSEIEKAGSEGGNPQYPNLLTSLGGQRNDRQQDQYWQIKYLDCMIAVGDVLAVTDSSQITKIGAAGGMFGHVLLVTAAPRCIQKHSPEYAKFLGSWPPGKVREIYQVPVIESTRSTKGINETDLLLYIDPKSGKITLHGEVDKDGDITAFENDHPEEVAVWQSPSVLRDSSCCDLKEQVIEEMKENQANWSWYTAMRAFMLPAIMEAQSLTPFEFSANKQQLFKEIQDCWNGAPICSSLPVIFWQRYLCKLSQSGRASEKFADKSGPLDMIMRYMPLRADRSLPGDLLKSLQASGWTNIQQLPTQKHSMSFGL